MPSGSVKNASARPPSSTTGSPIVDPTLLQRRDHLDDRLVDPEPDGDATRRAGCGATAGCRMQAETQPRACVDLGPVVAGTEDELQPEGALVEVHGALHVADVDRGVATPYHRASVVPRSIGDKALIPPADPGPLSCGSGGIRTPGPFRDSRFQGECIRPLCHASARQRSRSPRLAGAGSSVPSPVAAPGPRRVVGSPDGVVGPARSSREAARCGSTRTPTSTRRRSTTCGGRAAVGGARRAGRARRRRPRHRRPDPVLPLSRCSAVAAVVRAAGSRSPAAGSAASSRGRARTTPRSPRPARPGRRRTGSSTARSSRSTTPSTVTGRTRSPAPGSRSRSRDSTSSPAG